MPQKKIPAEKIMEIRELRRKGLTYSQIRRETRVSTGKIAEICEKEKPITTLNSIEKKVSGHDKSLIEFEKQFVSVRDRRIEDLISQDKDFVCPNCTSEFMAFEEGRKPYMKCPKCEYTIVFGAL
jgi:ribosomal protein S27AE